jgi:uncharacterized membrane protein
MAKMMRANLPTLRKTASYYVLHISVAMLVAYAITRDWHASIALSLIEPSVQAVAFFFHEKFWQRWELKRATVALPSPLPSSLSSTLTAQGTTA